MFADRFASALVAAAALSLGGLGAASAADMKPLLKAPAPPPAEPLDIHGFVDVTFLNDYITPRGLLVDREGFDTQVLAGLVLDLYKDKTGFINDISVVGGVWNNIFSLKHAPTVGGWDEFDWFLAADVTFAKNWTGGVQYIEFMPPSPLSFPGVERNIEFSLSYDDSSWGWAIPFHPYVKLFWAVQGPSTVVLGKGGGTYDIELGVVPTLDTKKYTGIPLVLTAPTWITVGPTGYWNRQDGTTNLCGALSTSPCATSNAGVVTTGIQGKLALDAIVPKRLGSWYVKAGARYYHVINDALLAAQEITVGGAFPSTHRDIGVVYAGAGFGF